MSVKSLVRSTLLVGSTSAATTLISILRVKVLALLVGPAGLGLLGTLAGLAGVGTTLFALGADTSGTRRIALGKDDPATLRRMRRALLTIAGVNGMACVALFWLARRPLALWVLGSEEHAFEVGLLGIVVALSLLAGLQTAQLQGLGRVGDIARVGILSSLIATLAGLLAVWHWGVGGLIVLILVQPAVAAFLARAYAPPLPVIAGNAGGVRSLHTDWRALVGEGTAFMLSYVVLALVPLAVRVLVIRDAGLEAAGHFHAAWTMSVIYVAFLLNAMASDYFPRLTGLVADRQAARRLVNEQVEIGLAIGGPIMLVMLAGAPWFVPLLYSQSFAPAVEIVEWQALGNLMKIAGWAIAFLSMARGRSVQFFLLELAWTSLYLALVWLGLPYLGLPVTGMAFAAACVAFLLLQTAVAWWTYGFGWEISALRLLLAFAAAGVLTLLAARHSAFLQAMTGGSLALLLGLFGLRRVLARVGPGGRIGGLAGHAFARLGWPLPPPALAR
jgi:PST family polysaccharide transporter